MGLLLSLVLGLSVFQLRVNDSVLLDDTDVAAAAVIRDGRNQPQIDIALTPRGSAHLAAATSGMTEQQVAIVIDGTVCAQPTVDAPLELTIIPVRGSFSEAQAAEMVAKINAAVRRR